MKTCGEIRLENLRAIVSEFGSAALRELLGIGKGQVSQYIGIHPTRMIGDHFARRIEQAFTLERGWLDNVHETPKSILQSIVDLVISPGANEIYQVDRIRGLILRANAIALQKALESARAGKQNALLPAKDEQDKGAPDVGPLLSGGKSASARGRTRRARR